MSAGYANGGLLEPWPRAFVAAVAERILTEKQRRAVALRMIERSVQGSSDENVARPLWEFAPAARSAVLSERRRRRLLQGDPEPIGDPEYS